MSKRQIIGMILATSPLLALIIYIVAMDGWKGVLAFICAMIVVVIVGYGAYLMDSK